MNSLILFLISILFIFIAIITLSAMKNKKREVLELNPKVPEEKSENKNPTTQKNSISSIFGWIGIIFGALLILWVGSKAIGGVVELFTPSPSSPVCTTSSFYPSSGEGYASVNQPIKAYLNPQRSHTRPQGVVRYEFENDPSVWIIEYGPAEGNKGIDQYKWWSMPKGNYIITPVNPEETIYFYWY